MKLNRNWFVIFFLIFADPSTALDAVIRIKDGDTIFVRDIEFRFDGIDAPEIDQSCLDENGVAWTCGIAARERLASLIGGRSVICEDQGADPVYPARRIGICSTQGDPVSLNKILVQEGWALNSEPFARGRFKADEDDAKAKRLGIWSGCFSSARDFRYWHKKKANLLGAACTLRHEQDARDSLFPDHPKMPVGCSIKGKVVWRAKLTGHRGIYHPENCRSYRRTKNPNRWFCSEDDARAAGFRKSFNC